MDGVDGERRRVAQLVRPADVRLPRVGLLQPRRRRPGRRAGCGVGIRLVLGRDGRTIGSPTRNSVPSGLRMPAVLLTEKIGPWPWPLASIAANSTFELV